MKDEYYAHSLEGKLPEDRHRLEDHLKRVVETARGGLPMPLFLWLFFFDKA